MEIIEFCVWCAYVVVCVHTRDGSQKLMSGVLIALHFYFTETVNSNPGFPCLPHSAMITGGLLHRAFTWLLKI